MSKLQRVREPILTVSKEVDHVVDDKVVEFGWNLAAERGFGSFDL
jgi:hypothetical protein